MILTHKTTPEERAAEADRVIARTRAEQGLPAHIEDDAILDQLAALLDNDTPIQSERGAA